MTDLLTKWKTMHNWKPPSEEKEKTAMRSSYEDYLGHTSAPVGYAPWIAAYVAGANSMRRQLEHDIITGVGIPTYEDFDDDTVYSVTDIKQIQMTVLKQVLNIIKVK
jgi:hypothetical protein